MGTAGRTKRRTAPAQAATAPSPILAGLNAEQVRAVTHPGGPLLIVAGAGTGKTTVLTKRIAWLVLDQHVPTDGLLALTFTEKAATEMEERVDRLLPMGYVDLWISTFHSFCRRILERHALDIGLPHDFVVLDETAAWLLMREHLDRFTLDYYRPRGNPTKFLHALLRHFSRCKDEAVTPADYLAYAQNLRLNGDSENRKSQVPNLKSDPSDCGRIEELANAYHVYEQLLLEHNALDFGDLLMRTLELFRTRPVLLARYRQQFRHVLVDEFQDTNWTQYEIVRILAAPANNLTVVADDDQAIYRWRGAAMSNILHFKEDYPTATSVSITANYRSRQEILDAAYRLIRTNDPARLEVSLGLDKRLVAARGSGGSLAVVRAQDARAEAEAIAADILALHGRGVPWSEMAILVRANSQADQFLPVLAAHGIPYQYVASRGLYRTTVVLDLLAILQLLDDYHESAAMYRVLNIPTFGLAYDDLLTLSGWASRKGVSLYTACRDARKIADLTPKVVGTIEHIIVHLADLATLARRAPVRAVLLAFLETSGYLKDISDEETAEDHEAVAHLNAFWRKVEQFETTVEDPSVRRFIAQITLERESGEQGRLPPDMQAGPDAVRVLTIHAAKGLEFAQVFLVNLVEQRFPATNRADPIELPAVLTKVIVPEGDVHLQEERRLCYVAATRAKERLVCTFADDYGGARARKPSRFLGELGLAIPASAAAGPRSVAVHRSTEHERTPAPPHHALPSRLSFTQLKAYATCPWQYHYAHILRIPLRGRWTLSFGQTMHHTLQQFFNLVLDQRSSQQEELFAMTKFQAPNPKSQTNPKHKISNAEHHIPTLDVLLELYDAAWVGEWYENPRQQQEYRENGTRILKEFYAKHEREGWPTIRATEQPFVVQFGAHRVMGKADRIDDVPNGVEIIDYKTGKPRQRLAPEDKMQLLIYQVAATQALGLTPAMLSYYYLEDNTKVSFLGTANELSAVAQNIEHTGERIVSGDFAPTPGPHCASCDFRNICPYAQR